MTREREYNKDHFPLPLIVRHIDGEMWELVQPFEYITKKGKTIHVPNGFVTDFASIPKAFWSFIGGPAGKYGPAAVCHDYLYFTQTTTRGYADATFLEAMDVLGVKFWRRWTMWLAVVSFGWIPWGKYREDKK